MFTCAGKSRNSYPLIAEKPTKSPSFEKSHLNGNWFQRFLILVWTKFAFLSSSFLI
jgi:hypothetical protein